MPRFPAERSEAVECAGATALSLAAEQPRSARNQIRDKVGTHSIEPAAQREFRERRVRTGNAKRGIRGLRNG